MSFETWRAKFYPIPADKVEHKDAAHYTMLRWAGLTPDNLERHGLTISPKVDRSVLEDGKVVFRTGSATSALCQQYLNDKHPCQHCPLAHIRDGVPCDGTRDEFETRSPFDVWLEDGSPRVVLYWLRISGKRGDV